MKLPILGQHKHAILASVIGARCDGIMMNKATIVKGMQAIASNDRDVAVALKQLGYPDSRSRPAGFESLLFIIVSQQLSKEAAAAIRVRLQRILPDPSPEALLGLQEGALEAAGLSRRKAEYAKGLASDIRNGRFDPGGLAALNDQDAISAIQKLRGFGRWSAEVYLLFSLQRQDIFPSGDLALQRSLQRLKSLAQRPGPEESESLVASWSPWRSVGSLFLWHYYRGIPACD